MTSDGVSYQKQDGNLTTVKSALDELITKSSKVNDLEKKVTDYEKGVHYLFDVAKVGDYVSYDAGIWASATAKPTKQGDFGGNEANKNKGYSVSLCDNTTTSLNGWRVLSKDEENKTVTIVHAGQPECYYHVYNSENQSSSVKALNERANKYKNTIYADSAHALDYNEAKEITTNISSTEDDLRKTGARYWLATPYNDDALYYVSTTGSINNNGYNFDSWGFRPVIVLKSSVITTGKGQDQVGNSDTWIIA